MSIPRLFVAILFLALFTMTVREVTDPDFWWHLRAGQYMSETGTIPHSDPFAFTTDGKEWVTHEWLSELGIFGLYRLGGFPLLVVVFSLLITLAFGLAYLRSEGRPYLAGFALLLGALATAPTWGVRPQMLTLLLMSVFLFLLDRYADRRKLKYLIPLPLLTLLWVNLHSGYAIGLVAIGVALLAMIIEEYGSVRQLSPSLRAAVPLGITFVLSLCAVLVNPNGARMFVYPFETLTSAAMQRYIQEWFSPDFHQAEWIPFALLLVLLLTTSLLARARVPLAHTLLLFLLGVLALRSARNIPLLALVAIPVLSAQLAVLVPLRAGTKPTPRPLKIVNLVLWLVLALTALVRVGTVLANQETAEHAKFPSDAVTWIEQNHPAPNLYNSYGWGGYLIWNLYPSYKVYIDGRADVYGDAFIEDFLTVYNATPDWQARLAARNVRLVLIEPEAPLAKALALDPHWSQEFADAQSVIFEKK